MSSLAQDRDASGGRRWKIGLFLAAYFLLFGAFGLVASRQSNGRGLMATLTFVECAALAVVTALFSVSFDPRELGVRRAVLRVLCVCGLTELASVVVLGVAWLAWGAAPFVGGLAAQLVILAFCLLLASVFALIRCSGSELLVAQLVSIFVACALMGTIFYADPLVEAQRSPEARSMMITGILATNPITAISWSLLEFDLMRQQLMYDSISVIGRWYRTPYPKWWSTTLVYTAVSAVTLVGAGLLRKHRILSSSRKGGQLP